MREIAVECADPDVLNSWEMLLPETTGGAPGVRDGGNGVTFRLTRSDRNAISTVTIGVRSLEQARAVLEEKGLLGVVTDERTTIAPDRISGLQVYLVALQPSPSHGSRSATIGGLVFCREETRVQGAPGTTVAISVTVVSPIVRGSSADAAAMIMDVQAGAPAPSDLSAGSGAMSLRSSCSQSPEPIPCLPCFTKNAEFPVPARGSRDTSRFPAGGVHRGNGNDALVLSFCSILVERPRVHSRQQSGIPI